ncbi:odorant receptor 85b-like [Vanessa atalanta]|uniref:odorant receptor 85b-like n=1 Tax=Vanessa atalanta TaxID=42275 RepID=UPI001FCD35AC|nr:odorant receptor 85b-like [Vanessa atalanta]
MSSKDKVKAKQEIHKTLKLCNFCTRKIGISFTDEQPKNLICKIWTYMWFLGSALILFLKLAGQVDYAVSKLVNSASVVEFVAGLHIIGYDTMSFGKMLTMWYKRNIFRNLLNELADLWPTSDRDKDSIDIKRQKLSRLRIGQFWYAFWNILGVWLYNLTPIVIYVYRKIQGTPANLGYIWHLSYPFDKTQPVYHELAFVFETFGGVVSVWSMLGSDILFMTMASHISMLLRLLQLKIRRLGTQNGGTINQFKHGDHYQEIISVIKTHQRLIMYGNDLEDAFSIVNLINVLLSSVDICCVVFNILLDPWMAMSNKFFLGAALTQVGILCWYADDIFTSSSGVADAVYNSGWYNSDIRCQRALLVMIQRSQKPLYFTALKFSSITMSTYSSILINSYSYFTLLYTVYISD